MIQTYFGENLIFIISQPRSGSTLLQRVLSGHPEIQTSAETWLMLHPVYGLKETGIEAEFHAKWAATAVKEFLENYTDGLHVYDAAIRAWAKTIYGNALSKSDKRYFLDKTPRYFFIVPELYRLFPKARFIFLIRNPMAVLDSLLKTYVKGRWPVLEFFKADLLLAPRLILEGIELLGDDAITVRYEELVENPDGVVSQLCDKLGIPYFREMLEYSRTAAPVGKLNDHAGIHQHDRPHSESVNKWMRMNEDAQECHFALSYVDGLGRDVVERLGYSFDDTKEALSRRSCIGGGRHLFPWGLAMRSRSEWSLGERIMADRYFAVTEQGPWAGNLGLVKRLFKRLLGGVGVWRRGVDLPKR